MPLKLKVFILLVVQNRLQTGVRVPVIGGKKGEKAMRFALSAVLYKQLTTYSILLSLHHLGVGSTSSRLWIGMKPQVLQDIVQAWLPSALGCTDY